MTSASWALQVALHDRLTNDPALATLFGGTARVFDHVPRGAVFPYVTFGIARADDWSTGDATGTSHAIVLHVWSRTTGRSEALAIADAIVAAIARAPVEPDGHRVVLLRQDAADIARQPDGETLLATIRFAALTEPAA